jgi:hypothetical protein
MNDHDDALLALYRAHAHEEPRSSLDAPILRAARRRALPISSMAALLCLSVLAAIAVGTPPPEKHPIITSRTVLPGFEDGRGRYLASDARIRLAAEQSGLYMSMQ